MFIPFIFKCENFMPDQTISNSQGSKQQSARHGCEEIPFLHFRLSPREWSDEEKSARERKGADIIIWHFFFQSFGAGAWSCAHGKAKLRGSAEPAAEGVVEG